MFSASKITFFSPHHKTFPRVFALIYTKLENSLVPPHANPFGLASPTQLHPSHQRQASTHGNLPYFYIYTSLTLNHLHPTITKWGY